MIKSMSQSSLEELSISNLRQKGINQASGKIYKGFVHDATKKTSVSTIPGKFENIIYDTKAKSGFGVSTTRFDESQTLAPGPGYYNSDATITNNSSILTSKLKDQTTNSQSRVNLSSITEQQYYQNTKKESIKDKVGFGTVERDAFSQKYIQQGPPVGFYNPSKDLKDLERRVHNKKGDPMFIESAIEKNKDIKLLKKIEVPGPGEYETTLKSKEINYHSAFHTSSQRNPDMIRNDYPAVGQYNLKRNLTDDSMFQKVGYQSMFQPHETQKRISAEQQLKIIKKFLSQDASAKRYKGNIQSIAEEPEQQPAVGQYNPSDAHYIKSRVTDPMFVDGLKDRFGDFYDKNLEKQPLPGPTKYDTNKYGIDVLTKEPALVKGSAFVSETRRQPYGDFEKKLGPNTSLPNYHKSKKSFILNIDRKWI